MKITSIKKTIRNTKRFAEIVKVLTKFGFRQLVIDTGLNRLMGQNKNDLDESVPEHSKNLPPQVRLRMVFEELGPTFIKLGQLLSTRPDLIPAEWAEEFKQLQDNCSHVPFNEIFEVLDLEFPGRLSLLFSSIEEEPLAAASIAQVHRAIMLDGTQVVIKVLRPGARSIIEEDMDLVEMLAQLLQQYFSDLGYSPTDVAKEFSRELHKEINFIIEGQSTDRLRRYFEDDENISFPIIYWSATTRNVLTMQHIKGRLLSSVSPGSLSSSDRRAIVANGTDAVFKQCLRFGFFHADPHPGNIFLLPGNKLCFIDCGMIGRLDRKTSDQLINLVASVIKADIDKLCRVVLELTNVDPTVIESREFRLELRHLTSQFQNVELQHLNITGLLSEFFSMLQRYHIQCPGDLMLLTKALTTIEGVAEQFDPSFDVLAHVEPQIQEIVMRRYSMGAIRARIGKTMTSTFELLEDLPGELQRFLDHAKHSRFTLNLELKRIEHLSETIDTSSRIMGIAMIIAALIVGSSILILADRMSHEPGFIGTLGIVGLILAGINTTGFIISFLLPRKKK
ncbi:AarF/ABC1/UbiB kinase family protein [Desulforhopalus sp. IMCC35007]|uniref:ABC1 kinase family protein n=1 Tax=Desulforhopalus sp. IMCC35007 TaxID=2569543 RepID=UPI0010ADACA9|nr:AarF/UbiB family protein [Desulforhopalus sp. IMCC35007]TKB12151.1 AarF/ABC1/UbiB kinase family protein [Desulforhopalus sp. IMCC35007]